MDKSLNITPLFTVGNQILVNFFDQGKGENYTSHVIEDNHSDEEYIITMQRVDGETPLYQLAEKKEENARLEAEVKELKAQLKKEQNQYKGSGTQNKRFSQMLDIMLSNEQQDDCAKLCDRSPHIGVTFKLDRKDPNAIQGYLQLATYAFMNLNDTVKGLQLTHDKLDPELAEFFMKFSPWLESFTNSVTMREGGKQLEAFDVPKFVQMPSFAGLLQCEKQ
jgi:hypothetical protein